MTVTSVLITTFGYSSCRPPGDGRALFDTALSVILEPLPRRLRLVSIPDPQSSRIHSRGGCRAHHVLADGLRGLNVLAALVDPGFEPAGVPFPASPPLPLLARDALLMRFRGIRQAAAPGAPCVGRCSLVEAFGQTAVPLLSCATDESRLGMAVVRLERSTSQRLRIGAGLLPTMRFSLP